jgi:hypothetical protein
MLGCPTNPHRDLQPAAIESVIRIGSKPAVTIFSVANPVQTAVLRPIRVSVFGFKLDILATCRNLVKKNRKMVFPRCIYMVNINETLLVEID